MKKIFHPSETGDGLGFAALLELSLRNERDPSHAKCPRRSRQLMRRTPWMKFDTAGSCRGFSSDGSGYLSSMVLVIERYSCRCSVLSSSGRFLSSINLQPYHLRHWSLLLIIMRTRTGPEAVVVPLHLPASFLSRQVRLCYLEEAC
jgi:hypothetical protein